MTIERIGDRVSVHTGRSEAHLAGTFLMNERHVRLQPVRVRLVHDDLIEAAPGVVFRFRLRD